MLKRCLAELKCSHEKAQGRGNNTTKNKERTKAFWLGLFQLPDLGRSGIGDQPIISEPAPTPREDPAE
jgi:hypothetical protein